MIIRVNCRYTQLSNDISSLLSVCCTFTHLDILILNIMLTDIVKVSHDAAKFLMF